MKMDVTAGILAERDHWKAEAKRLREAAQALVDASAARDALNSQVLDGHRVGTGERLRANLAVAAARAALRAALTPEPRHDRT